MQKFTAWLRRHKTKFLDLGALLGLTLIVWAYFNAPVNINRMTSADWQDTHIQAIGAVTIQKLSANVPYTDIRDIDKIKGIGPVKMAQINRHFTTWDTAKADLWFPLFLIGLVLFLGCIFIRAAIVSDKRAQAKRLENKYFKDEKR